MIGGAGFGGTSITNTTTHVADFSGATFHTTSRAEMQAWAREDLLPAMRDGVDIVHTSHGA